jgi:hypothetical protein
MNHFFQNKTNVFFVVLFLIYQNPTLEFRRILALIIYQALDKHIFMYHIFTTGVVRSALSFVMERIVDPKDMEKTRRLAAQEGVPLKSVLLAAHLRAVALAAGSGEVLTGVVSKSKTSLVFINQLREKIGVMFGNPETTSGGRALKFFSSIRIDIRRKDQLKTPDGKIIGNRTKIKVVKNKIAPPFTECEFDIMYDEGISRTGSLLDLGIEHKILDKKGAWIAYQGELIGQGRDAAKQALKDKPELAAKVQAAIQEKVSVAGGTVVTGAAEEAAE